MASIFKLKNNDGTTVWRPVVRIKGYPAVCNHFERKQEADDWAHDVERKIKLGQFKLDQHKQQHTFTELIDRYISDGALQHHRSAEDTLCHLTYWKERLGAYALIHLTPDLIGKERQLFLDTPSAKGKKRSSATANRYISSLSSSLSYATRQLRWINENPCISLKKLKENPGRDGILTEEEIVSLLEACRQSRSPYLFCIVLISLTTGARQGEILTLEWKHIDFENKLAFLTETKNGRPRGLSLADPVIKELQKLHNSRNTLNPLVLASKAAFGRLA